MQYRKCRWSVTAVVVALTLPLMAQDKESKDSPAKAGEKKPSEADMMAMMMEMAKPGENHQLLQEVAGNWSYTVKWWMSPETPPSVSSGTTVFKTVMDGRYVVGEHTGKMQTPGPDGKMVDMEFKGMGIEGYDNAKKKFVASWVDNMGTGIMMLEGTYEAAAKTLTYTAEYELFPGVKTKMRQLVKIIDKDHRKTEFYEQRGGKEVKTMEIVYERKG